MADVSSGRRPRGLIRVNGATATPLKFAVENNTHFQADTFSVTLEAWQQPEDFGLAYWADATNVMVEVLLGFLGPDDDAAARPTNLTSLIVGQVDDVDVDPVTGNLVVSGRDLTGKLIDTKTTQMWPDQTASQIVTKLAQQAGLTPKVTATKTPVGQYQHGAYAAVGRDVPMWDLITFLAQQEGFDAYVSGTTLYFGPNPADDDQNPFVISCARNADGVVVANVGDLHLKRSLTLAKDITVTVLSHNIETGRPLKAIARRQGSEKAGTTSFRGGQTAQNYIIRRPNITQQQALDLAQKTLADLSRFERTFTGSSWDDGTLTARKQARITGTGSSFDQDYYFDRVTHELAFGAASVRFSGKNHPVESEPTA